MRKLRGYILIARPLNCLIGFLSIFVGGLLADKELAAARSIIIASFAGSLIGAGGNIINDCFDVAIDRINKPSRPLPSGVLTKAEAMVYGILLFAVGITGSILLNVSAFIIACAAVVVLFLYGMRFKRTVLVGNFIVALVTAFAFIYGAAAAGNILRSVVPAVFGLLLILGREIIKDIEDIEGDRQQDVRTFPVRFGVETSIVLITSVFALLIVVTALVYLLHIYNITYFVVVLLGVDSILVYCIYSMWKHKAKATWGKMSTVLKWDMFVGLIAIYVG